METNTHRIRCERALRTLQALADIGTPDNAMQTARRIMARHYGIPVADLAAATREVRTDA